MFSSFSSFSSRSIVERSRTLGLLQETREGTKRFSTSMGNRRTEWTQRWRRRTSIDWLSCCYSFSSSLGQVMRERETKMDQWDKLSQAWQQERVELQTTIKNLSKAAKGLSENEPVASPTETNTSHGHDLATSTDIVPPSSDTATTTDGSASSAHLHGESIAVSRASMRVVGHSFSTVRWIGSSR